MENNMLILPGTSSFHISCTLRTIPPALGWCCDIHTVVMKPLKWTLKNVTAHIKMLLKTKKCIGRKQRINLPGFNQ